MTVVCFDNQLLHKLKRLKAKTEKENEFLQV